MKPTHRTIGGIEAEIRSDSSATSYALIAGVQHPVYLQNEIIPALFEPIPPEPTVTIPLSLVKAIHARVDRGCCLSIADNLALERLIAAADAEAKGSRE